MIYKILLFIAIGINVTAQILLKTSLQGLDLIESGHTVQSKIKSVAMNPFFWGAVFLYGTGFLMYSAVLSKLELSRIYPVASATTILLIFIISILFVHESVTIPKIIGLVLCLAGILLILK